jgi:ankyrin repeat protein
MTGSFNPIDIGEWSADAYIGDVAKFFKSIVSFNRMVVLQMIQDGTADVNRRDHVGRTPLHVAILVKAVEIACDLIDNGARISSRLADGRTALHVAARLDLSAVVRRLIERSLINAENAKEDKNSKSNKEGNAENERSDGVGKKEAAKKDDADDGGDDEGDDDDRSQEDWSFVDRPPKTKQICGSEGGRNDAVIPEDESGVPDVLDINLTDWDLSWPPLFHAIASGSLSVIDELLAAGADVKTPFKFVVEYQQHAFHPLTLAILIDDDDRACEVIERLLTAGATSTATDEDMLSIFHRFVCSGRSALVSRLLRADPNSKAAINFPAVFEGAAVFPLVTSINNGSYSLVAILLAHGAKVNYTEEDLSLLRSVKFVDSSPSGTIQFWC